MNDIWRFYTDADHRWRWQRLSAARQLIAESRAGYEIYGQCVAAAQGEGYEFLPSQEKLKQMSSH